MVSTIDKREKIGHEPNSQRTFTVLLFVVSPGKLVLLGGIVRYVPLGHDGGSFVGGVQQTLFLVHVI
jgi:hypothetical protein